MKSQRSGSGNSLYADVSPYPPIQVSDESWEYGNAMLSNMGSSNSEMSAISLYFYNQLLTDQVYDEISAIFENINKVEMHHLEIFGSLALRLGADPRLWSYFNGKKVYWTPGYNQYPVKLKELLYNSVQAEKAAIEKYTEQADTIRDPYIVAILNRIILDERKHEAIFTDLYNQYGT